MNPTRVIRDAAGFTQQELAERAGTSQTAIAAYEGGRKSPTWRTIERLAQAADVELVVQCVPALTREDRRSLALHEAIVERLKQDPDAVLARARASMVRMHALHPAARPLLDEWRLFLRRPLASLIPVLLDPSQRGRDLRQVTPFTGVLSARERADVYRRFGEAYRQSVGTTQEAS